MDVKESQIVTFAFSSRIFILVLQCFANAVIPDHDAGVFLPPRDKSQFSWLDHVVHFLLGGLQRWDAVYFTHIMQFGYTYQNCVAFFPFYPLLASSISSLLQLFGMLHYSSWILLTSVILNLILFIWTAKMLYRLGQLFLNAEVAAYAAMMFCMNPASIFMSAPYSETTYMFLLIFALLKLHVGATFTASFLIGLSVFTRSNGIVGIGFILHAIAKSLIVKLQMPVPSGKITLLTFRPQSLCLLIAALVKSFICVALSLVPFFIYQFYIYQKFCKHSSPSDLIPADLITYGRDQGYHLQGDDPSPWCYNYLPMSYTYIQKHHWDVGFLRYYKIKQIPNFLLALPIICVSFGSCLYFFQINPQPFYRLGLWATKDLLTSQMNHKNLDNIKDISDHSPTASNSTTKQVATKDSEIKQDLFRRIGMSEDVVVYVFHLLGLTLFGCFFMHIQVLTRLLCSSSPLLYWYCGALFVHGKYKASKGFIQNMSDKQNDNSKTRIPAIIRPSNIYLSILTKLHFDFIVDVVVLWPSLSYQFHAVFIYCLVYCIIGTVMFCNFLPWT